MLKLQVIGFLGNDSNVNNVNGKSVINFSVAHSEKWKDQQGQDRERTTWVNCSYWVERTNIAQYLKKGLLVYVEGVPEAVTYKDNKGEDKPQLRLRVSLVQLLGGKKDEGTQSTSAYQGGSSVDGGEDDLPF